VSNADFRRVLYPDWVLLDDGRVARGQAVVVRGSRIEAVVPQNQTVDGEHLELPGHLLMPGLINLHTHVGAGPIARGISEDYPLPPGMPFYLPLSRLWRHAYRPEVLQAYRSIVEWDLLAMLRTGTTTVLNHASTDVEGYLELAERSGVRTVAGPTVPLDVTHRLGRLDAGQARRTDSASGAEQAGELAAGRALIEAWEGRADRISVLLGPAAVHAVDRSVLESVARLSEELGCLVTTHLCQAPSELAETQARYGRTPLQVLADLGLATPRLVAAHGTYLPAEDLALAADSGITIAHCASRKAKEAMVSPSVSFREAGIRVGLGTDGFSADMVEELKFAAVLGKIGTHRAAAPTARETVLAATTGNAAALGRDDLGTIAPGQLADLIAVDLSGPVTGPVFDPLQTLTYYGNGRDVQFSMIHGEIVMRDAVVTGFDATELGRRVADSLGTIWEEAIALGLLDDVLQTQVNAHA
jgi:5-methylthioadenosine/S-adenosylhomocysteine deaminase